MNQAQLTRYSSSKSVHITLHESLSQLMAPHIWWANQHDGPLSVGLWVIQGYFLICQDIFSISICIIINAFVRKNLFCKSFHASFQIDVSTYWIRGYSFFFLQYNIMHLLGTGKQAILSITPPSGGRKDCAFELL